jgi:cell pole-organizing protein PopZ
MTDLIIIYSGPDACILCLGWKRVADSDDGESWKYWAELPAPSNIAVSLGLVSPVECPRCKGSGAEPIVSSESGIRAQLNGAQSALRDALAEIARLTEERDEAHRARRLAQGQLDNERRLTLGRYAFYHRHLAMGFVRTRDPELANWASVEAGHRIDQEGGQSFEDVAARIEAERDAALARERIAVEAYQQQQTNQRELETLYQDAQKRLLASNEV